MFEEGESLHWCRGDQSCLRITINNNKMNKRQRVYRTRVSRSGSFFCVILNTKRTKWLCQRTCSKRSIIIIMIIIIIICIIIIARHIKHRTKRYSFTIYGVCMFICQVVRMLQQEFVCFLLKNYIQLCSDKKTFLLKKCL